MNKIKLPAVEAGSRAARRLVRKLPTVGKDRSVAVDEGVAGAARGHRDDDAIRVALGSGDRPGILRHE
ncbi:MAG: hypothetical protein NUV56_03315 [Candidatus Uhrbacteria bacterium]|nr:hypothetical protein [Candidatus Uhrbacteria bacterium]